VERELIHPKAKDRRDAMRAANVCINGTKVGAAPRPGRLVHGPVIQGGRCARCIDVAKMSR
jgi:hypothetical protein